MRWRSRSAMPITGKAGHGWQRLPVSVATALTSAGAATNSLGRPPTVRHARAGGDSRREFQDDRQADRDPRRHRRGQLRHRRATASAMSPSARAHAGRPAGAGRGGDAVHRHLSARGHICGSTGFGTALEREWFRLLQSVQGVGAKVALAVLSTLAAARTCQCHGAARHRHGRRARRAWARRSPSASSPSSRTRRRRSPGRPPGRSA